MRGSKELKTKIGRSMRWKLWHLLKVTIPDDSEEAQPESQRFTRLELGALSVIGLVLASILTRHFS
jgi:hypothetical protein